MRGGTNERRFQRFRERSEEEDKAMKAVFPKLRLRKANVKGNPWRPGRRRQEGHEGRGRGQPTRYPNARLRSAVSSQIQATLATLKTHSTS
jgi:hypothetical protein